MDQETLLQTIEEFSLRPGYDEGSLSWLLNILATKQVGELRKKIVRQSGHGVLGYYLYYDSKGGVSNVLQVAARKDATQKVLGDLIYDAWAGRALALSGRLDPRYAYGISNQASYFRYSGTLFLFHTREPEIQHAPYTGDAVLMRLEDEWWIPFGSGVDAEVPAD
jgi:hypothetical protein